MTNIPFYKLNPVPIEMHKARIIQKMMLLPIDKRYECLTNAGNNSHLLKNDDVFLDMLTDSGVNAMSDKQLGAMMLADDAYAGSNSYFKLKDKIQEIFNMPYFLPCHQGRACEHLLCKVFVKPDNTIPMNYHFTTTKEHIKLAGGKVEELLIDEGIKPQSDCLFKGNFDIQKLKDLIENQGANNIPFVRVEAETNLIGGQPISLENMIKVSEICKSANIKLVMDASLLSDNLHFIKTREEGYKDKDIKEILNKICELFDIIYFSGRKLSSSKGGGICFKNKEDFLEVRELLPLYEGFSTYGGMSVREIECITVGLDELLDEDFISQGPIFIEEMVKLLESNNVPVVTPSGGLGVHLDCEKFVPHIKPNEYPGACVNSALYLISGIRGTERGTLSEARDENGNEVFAKMELLRLALPRRVFTLSHIIYAVDRITWLYENRNLIGSLKFSNEPNVLRFFFGRLEPVGDWQDKLIEKFKQDFKSIF